MILPVLVGGAAMPLASDLPDHLQSFALRNAASGDARRDFEPHMERLTWTMFAEEAGRVANRRRQLQIDCRHGEVKLLINRRRIHLARDVLAAHQTENE